MFFRQTRYSVASQPRLLSRNGMHVWVWSRGVIHPVHIAVQVTAMDWRQGP